MTTQELRDDPCCVEGVTAVGIPVPAKRSLIQTYQFDASQDCKLRADDEHEVRFCGALDTEFTIVKLDFNRGELQLKKGSEKLMEECGGEFPSFGSLLPYEYVSKHSIPGFVGGSRRNSICTANSTPLRQHFSLALLPTWHRPTQMKPSMKQLFESALLWPADAW